MKYIDYLLAFITTFLLIVLVLLISFEVAIYGDSEHRFFKYAYEKYQVTDELELKISDIMNITDVILDYLQGKSSDLNYQVTIDNEEVNFFNRQDLLHLKDVRDIFNFLFILKYILIFVILVCLIIIIKLKGNWLKLIPKSYFINLVGLGTIILGVLIFSLFNFKEVFNLFHRILFDNNLWLFHPNTDLMIHLFPLVFFKDFVIYYFVILVIFIVFLSLFFFRWQKIVK